MYSIVEKIESLINSIEFIKNDENEINKNIVLNEYKMSEELYNIIKQKDKTYLNVIKNITIKNKITDIKQFEKTFKNIMKENILKNIILYLKINETTETQYETDETDSEVEENEEIKELEQDLESKNETDDVETDDVETDDEETDDVETDEEIEENDDEEIEENDDEETEEYDTDEETNEIIKKIDKNKLKDLIKIKMSHLEINEMKDMNDIEKKIKKKLIKKLIKKIKLNKIKNNNEEEEIEDNDNDDNNEEMENEQEDVQDIEYMTEFKFRKNQIEALEKMKEQERK